MLDDTHELGKEVKSLRMRTLLLGLAVSCSVPQGWTLEISTPRGSFTTVFVDSDPIKSISVSPNGRQILFLKGGAPYIASLDGSKQWPPFTDSSPVHRADWTADGKVVYYVGGLGQIIFWSLDRTRLYPLEVKTDRFESSRLSMTNPVDRIPLDFPLGYSLSPDRKQLAAWACPRGRCDITLKLLVYDIAGAQWKWEPGVERHPRATLGPSFPFWSADAKSVAPIDQRLSIRGLAHVYTHNTGQHRTEERAIEPDYALWSPDRQLIAATQGKGLWLFQKEGGEAIHILGEKELHDDVLDFAWMPDSKSLLVSVTPASRKDYSLIHFRLAEEIADPKRRVEFWTEAVDLERAYQPIQADAAQALEDFLVRYPSSSLRAEALYSLGELYSNRQDERRWALMETIVNEAPRSEFALMAFVWYLLDVWFNEKDGPEKMQALLNHDLSPRLEDAVRFGLGASLEGQERYAEALAAFREAADKAKSSATRTEALLHEARVLSEGQLDISSAALVYHELLKDPSVSTFTQARLREIELHQEMKSGFWKRHDLKLRPLKEIRVSTEGLSHLHEVRSTARNIAIIRERWLFWRKYKAETGQTIPGRLIKRLRSSLAGLRYPSGTKTIAPPTAKERKGIAGAGSDRVAPSIRVELIQEDGKVVTLQSPYLNRLPWQVESGSRRYVLYTGVFPQALKAVLDAAGFSVVGELDPQEIPRTWKIDGFVRWPEAGHLRSHELVYEAGQPIRYDIQAYPHSSVTDLVGAAAFGDVVRSSPALAQYWNTHRLAGLVVHADVDTGSGEFVELRGRLGLSPTASTGAESDLDVRFVEDDGKWQTLLVQ